jgi:hypothetical protein
MLKKGGEKNNEITPSRVLHPEEHGANIRLPVHRLCIDPQRSKRGSKATSRGRWTKLVTQIDAVPDVPKGANAL